MIPAYALQVSNSFTYVNLSFIQYYIILKYSSIDVNTRRVAKDGFSYFGTALLPDALVTLVITDCLIVLGGLDVTFSAEVNVGSFLSLGSNVNVYMILMLELIQYGNSFPLDLEQYRHDKVHDLIATR